MWDVPRANVICKACASAPLLEAAEFKEHRDSFGSHLARSAIEHWEGAEALEADTELHKDSLRQGA